MVKGLYKAASSLIAKQKNVEITANNLANINTTGFKREIPFSEIIARLDEQPKKQISDMSKGSFVETTNPLDLAINGDAFFMVKTDDGVELTANGRFTLDDEGFVVNEDGFRVQGANGEIDLSETIIGQGKEFEITKNGDVKIGKEIVNKILVAKVDDQTKMQRQSGQYFSFPQGGYSLASPDEFEVMQGHLEESNINPIIEMQNMIQIEKDFEATQKMISYMDQRMAKNREIGRI